MQEEYDFTNAEQGKFYIQPEKIEASILSLAGKYKDRSEGISDLSVAKESAMMAVIEPLCSRQRLQGSEILSFDNDIKKCNR